MSHDRAILVFLKNPKPGSVKTRLAASVGPERAAEIYRLLTREVFRQLPDSAQVIVMFDPPEAEKEIRDWVQTLSQSNGAMFISQRDVSLGERLSYAFASAFNAGFTRVAAIGTDCIEITPALMNEAFQSLDASDCVIGPAEDGGYYLIALKAPQHGLFKGIAWSTSSVFVQTSARIKELGLSSHLLPRLHDVDDLESWRRMESLVG